MKFVDTIIKLFVISVMSVAFINVVAAPRTFASAKSAVCEGAGLIVSGPNNDCSASTDSPPVEGILQQGLNLFSAIIGIIAVIMIMIGGLKFITSTGDSAQTNSAKNTIIWAAVGLVIVALAQVIVHFVLKRFTGIPPPIAP